MALRSAAPGVVRFVRGGGGGGETGGGGNTASQIISASWCLVGGSKVGDGCKLFVCRSATLAKADPALGRYISVFYESPPDASATTRTTCGMPTFSCRARRSDPADVGAIARVADRRAVELS